MHFRVQQPGKLELCVREDDVRTYETSLVHVSWVALRRAASRVFAEASESSVWDGSRRVMQHAFVFGSLGDALATLASRENVPIFRRRRGEVFHDDTTCRISIQGNFTRHRLATGWTAIPDTDVVEAAAGTLSLLSSGLPRIDATQPSFDLRLPLQFADVRANSDLEWLSVSMDRDFAARVATCESRDAPLVVTEFRFGLWWDEDSLEGTTAHRKLFIDICAVSDESGGRIHQDAKFASWLFDVVGLETAMQSRLVRCFFQRLFSWRDVLASGMLFAGAPDTRLATLAQHVFRSPPQVDMIRLDLDVNLFKALRDCGIFRDMRVVGVCGILLGSETLALANADDASCLSVLASLVRHRTTHLPQVILFDTTFVEMPSCCGPYRAYRLVIADDCCELRRDESLSPLEKGKLNPLGVDAMDPPILVDCVRRELLRSYFPALAERLRFSGHNPVPVCICEAEARQPRSADVTSWCFDDLDATGSLPSMGLAVLLAMCLDLWCGATVSILLDSSLHALVGYKREGVLFAVDVCKTSRSAYAFGQTLRGTALSRKVKKNTIIEVRDGDTWRTGTVVSVRGHACTVRLLLCSKTVELSLTDHMWRFVARGEDTDVEKILKRCVGQNVSFDRATPREQHTHDDEARAVEGPPGLAPAPPQAPLFAGVASQLPLPPLGGGWPQPESTSVGTAAPSYSLDARWTFSEER